MDRALLFPRAMKVESRKFDVVLDVPEDRVIRFPMGLIGMEQEKEFVLLEREQSPRIAWLQSTRNPDLVLPIVSGHELAEEYPDVPLDGAIFSEHLGAVGDESAVMVVLSCPPGAVPTVNLASPLVVNSKTRTGTQIILRGSRYASRELLAFRAASAA